MNVISMISAALQSDVTELVAASFKDFHAKGLDYICLKRTPNHTVKIYILDGDASKLPEVVNPHDHRYPFRTTVLRGQMVDQRFERGGPGPVYEAFDYLTPLNGGSGFSWRGEERLAHVGRTRLHRFDQLMTAPEMLHTISMEADQTIIMLDQYGDVLPVDVPTSTWVMKGHPKPDTSGLYSKFTESEFMDRLVWLKGVI